MHAKYTHTHAYIYFYIYFYLFFILIYIDFVFGFFNTKKAKLHNQISKYDVRKSEPNVRSVVLNFMISLAAFSRMGKGVNGRKTACVAQFCNQ